MTAQYGTALKNQILPLLFLTAIFFIGFISRLLLAPLLPAIEKDLAIGHGEAGSFFLFVSAGLFISLLFSNIVVSKITHRTSIVLSATILGVALIATAFARDIWQIYVCLFLWGLSGGLYLPSGIATLTTLIKPVDWGKALAVHELAPNLSFVAVPIIVELLFNWFSWRGIPVVFGFIAILMGTIYARYGKGGRFYGDIPEPSTYKAIMRNPSFWIMTFLFTLGVIGSLGIFTMLPLYLIFERGMERELANNLLGLSRISCIFVPFAAGWITDRLGAKRALVGIFLLAGIVTILLGVAPDSWVVPVLFMQPVFAVCFFPAGFAAISFLGPPSQRNYVVSMTSALALLLGAGVVPACLGILGEKVSFSLGFSLAGGLMITGALLALGLKLMHHSGSESLVSANFK
jgi:NNP family nitrate/nitrite transporter-like MFS transporter